MEVFNSSYPNDSSEGDIVWKRFVEKKKYI